MEPLFILAVTFALLWVIFILPQQRRVRAHQALVASVQPGDEVILSAGIYGRILDLGPDDLTLEIAPGVEIRVARQAVLRLVEDATGEPDDAPVGEIAGDDIVDTGVGAGDDIVDTGTRADDAGHTDSDIDLPPAADGEASGPAVPDPDNRGPAAPGPNV
ncbi:MAG TPA: preprotein translocase subunit YajC [Acidimicrobiales bacterium]|nr:preprotein translocase subunit YajC [Acidimicrobiales bacterium]